MIEAVSFQEFVGRIRAGDQEAAVELVKLYEPVIRREIRMQNESQRFNRVFDSMDICQSVLASFFWRSAAGQYDLEAPANLEKLLVRMAKNKFASATRALLRRRRDSRRAEASDVALSSIVDPLPTPVEVVAGQDMLIAFRRCLTKEESRVADLRSQGWSWTEIADALGGTAQSRRMQLSRAVQRAGRQLGLGDHVECQD